MNKGRILFEHTSYTVYILMVAGLQWLTFHQVGKGQQVSSSPIKFDADLCFKHTIVVNSLPEVAEQTIGGDSLSMPR